jgi:hypothetical protein
MSRLIATASLRPLPDARSRQSRRAEVVLRSLECCDTYYRTLMGGRTNGYGNALQAARALRARLPRVACPVTVKIGMMPSTEPSTSRERSLGMQSGAKPRLVEILAQYAVIGEALAIVVAMVSIGIQWRQANVLAEAEHLRSISEHAANFNFTIVGSEPLSDVWFSYGRPSDVTPTQRHQYRTLLIQWLIFHENIFFQHENGLLDDAIYRSWDRDLEENLPRHDLDALGMPIEAMFRTSFGRHLKEIVERSAATPSAKHDRPAFHPSAGPSA